MDRVSKEKRSWIMRQVKSAGSKSTELAFLAVLRENHITGWRRNFELYGKPDFVFPRARVAVFVDGCFWHGHPQRCRIPKTNRAYWLRKIRRNVLRDKTVNKVLLQRGWKVIRIWEHEVQDAVVLAHLREVLVADDD